MKMNQALLTRLLPSGFARCRLIALIQIALFAITPLATGQTAGLSIKFDNVSIKDGLSQSSPNCIFQDSRGLLWIGTDDGLNKYDGYQFVIYKPDQKNPFGISNSRILSIAEDADGTMWIGTNGGGLNRYDRNLDRFYPCQPSKDDPSALAGQIVHCILPFDNGVIWLGTESGIMVYRSKSGSFVNHSVEMPYLQTIGSVAVRSLIRGKGNTVWIGTESGLFAFYPLLKKIEEVAGASGATQKKDFVHSLIADKTGNLWAGTQDGLRKYDQLSFEPLPVPDIMKQGLQIQSLLEDTEGNIWAGTFGSGLYVISPNESEPQHFLYDYNNPYSLSNNEVLSMFLDKSGIVWVGTNGLDKFNRHKEKFNLFDYVPFTREKLVFRNIHPIYEDEYGVLWIGSKTDGVHLLDRQNKSYNRLVHLPGSPYSVSSNRIRSICEYPQGTVWVGTEDQGLNKLLLDANRKVKKVEYYRNQAENPESLSSNKIYSIFADAKGDLWLGTDNGLTIFNPETETARQFLPDTSNPNTISHSTVYCVYGGTNGTIWLATDYGVNRYNPSDGTFSVFVHVDEDSTSLIHNEILCFHQDDDNNLWIGTYGKGIDRLDLKTGKFTHYTSIQKLSSAVVYGILADESGILWLSTNNGILKFDHKNMEINQFNIEDGLQSNEFNGSSYYKSILGEMFFGGQYGFNSFFPNQVVMDSVAPDIVITDLYIHNKPVAPGDDSPVNVHITEAKEIVLNHKQNNFALYFSALHFANPQRNQYRYKLEGYDREWIDASGKRFVTYTNLPYRNYQFRVIASNSDGIWNEAGLSVRIRVVPPFWATLWFKLVLILMAGSGLFYAIRQRLQFIQRQKQIFEEKFRTSSAELEEAQTQLQKQHDEIVIQKRELILREKDQESLLWFNKGLGIFSDIMSRNKESIHVLCKVTIEKLAEYVEAQQGGVFLLNEDNPGDSYLEHVADYAYAIDRKGQKFIPGEGYVGICYQERHFVEVDNLPETYAILRSGLGEESLRYLLLAPMLVNDMCIGVIELGSFRKIKGYRVSFIEKMLESFTSVIHTERANEKLKRLIEQSTQQAGELEEREEQLRMHLEEIMATQEESARREDELIKLAEESATREEMLKYQIDMLKLKYQEKTGEPYTD